MQIGQPTLGAWLQELEPPSACLVSNLYNNLWFTNFPAAHVGPISARYVFRFGPADEIETFRQSTRDCTHPQLIGYAGEKRLPLPPLIG